MKYTLGIFSVDEERSLTCFMSSIYILHVFHAYDMHLPRYRIRHERCACVVYLLCHEYGCRSNILAVHLLLAPCLECVCLTAHHALRLIVVDILGIPS